MNRLSPLLPLLALVLAPLLLGVINRVKALFAGRHGAPLLQAYFDLAKLLRKGAVNSRTTSWVFRAGPLVGLAAVLTALLLLPLGGVPAVVSFPGDLVVLAGLLGLMRFVTVVAALDTGSSFEGMGGSREVWFAALAEPVLFVALATLARQTGGLSLSGVFARLDGGQWLQTGGALVLVVAALFILLLAENARIPVDDPNTHLELTMIHEVMVLDHSGPDFGFVLYGAALKLWLFAALLAGVLIPGDSGNVAVNLAAAVGGVFLVAVVVGVVESVMARLRLVVVPQLLVGAGALAATAFLLGLK